MPYWLMGLPRRRLRSICTVDKKMILRPAFPYTKRLYLSPPGMWVIWLWGSKKRNMKKEEKKSHE